MGNKEDIILESESKWSEEGNKPKDWQYALFSLFIPLSITLTYLGSFIMKLGNILMFDTHHLEIRVTPKDK